MKSKTYKNYVLYYGANRTYRIIRVFQKNKPLLHCIKEFLHTKGPNSFHS